MKQMTFADAEYAGKRKQTRKELFLIEMERKRSINPVRPEGVALQDAEPGEQFHGSSAS